MTHSKATEHEHIHGAVELIRAKARNRLAFLKVKQTTVAAPALDAEIIEIERIERLSSEAWRDLHEPDA